jgi:hypothetical protein
MLLLILHLKRPSRRPSRRAGRRGHVEGTTSRDGGVARGRQARDLADRMERAKGIEPSPRAWEAGPGRAVTSGSRIHCRSAAYASDRHCPSVTAGDPCYGHVQGTDSALRPVEDPEHDPSRAGASSSVARRWRRIGRLPGRAQTGPLLGVVLHVPPWSRSWRECGPWSPPTGCSTTGCSRPCAAERRPHQLAVVLAVHQQPFGVWYHSGPVAHRRLAALRDGDLHPGPVALHRHQERAAEAALQQGDRRRSPRGPPAGARPRTRAARQPSPARRRPGAPWPTPARAGRPARRAARRIVAASPRTAVLVLTMFGDDDSVFAAMRAGARGYLRKGAGQAEIVQSIQAVARGEAVFGPAVAGRVLAYFSGPPPAPAERSPNSPSGNGKCWSCWPAGSSTPRSLDALGSAPKRSATTSATSSPSCRSPTARKR